MHDFETHLKFAVKYSKFFFQHCSLNLIEDKRDCVLITVQEMSLKKKCLDCTTAGVVRGGPPSDGRASEGWTP